VTPRDLVPEGEQDVSVSRVWVDFNTGGFNRSGSDGGRVARPSLSTTGTREDITRLGVVLQSGVHIDIWMDDVDAEGKWDPLIGRGTIDFTDEEGWVVEVALANISSLSELS
jgi:hypothetical protein